MDKENFILKKIRYYQATISDYETFWNEKIKESQSEISEETKDLKKHREILYYIYKINHNIIRRKDKRSCKIQQI